MGISFVRNFSYFSNEKPMKMIYAYGEIVNATTTNYTLLYTKSDHKVMENVGKAEHIYG
jgi:hypothetical protein